MKKTPASRRVAASLLALAALSGTGSALAAGNAVLAIYQQPETLDPYNTNTTITTAVTKSFYEGLFAFDKDMKLKNVLAESYEVSKDGLVYTFKLRSGVKFHDGTDFNAAAAKANLDRVMDPANRLLRANQFNRVAKVEAVNPQTLRITLKEPFGPFINALGHASAAMISPAALAKWGSKDIAFHPVGTGPFEFVEWKQTEAIVGKKFANYWKKGYPKVDQVTWKPVTENNTRAAMLQTGEADFAFTLPYEQIATLKKSDKVEVVTAPSIIQRFLTFNMLQKPFDNPKVREAIGYAINKEALSKVAFNGYAFPAQGFVPQGRGIRREDAADSLQRGQGQGTAEGSRLPQRFRDRAVERLQQHHQPEGDPVPAAAAAAGGHQGVGGGAGARQARRNSRCLARSQDLQAAPVLHRLVVLHRRGRLGAASAVLHRIVGAQARELRLLQQPGGG